MPTRECSACGSAWNFTWLLKISLSAGFWPFVLIERIVIMCMSFEGRVNRIQAHSLHKLVLPVFSLLFFSFLFQNKTAFIPRHFKNPPLKDIRFLNGVQLKTQNVPFRSLIDRAVSSQKYLYQLWKLFCWIRNQINIAMHTQKGVKCPLIIPFWVK